MDNLYSSVSKGGCYDTNHYGPRPLPLLKLNYLGEYFTEAEKELVRLNLGIHNDSLVRKFIVENGLLKDLIPDHEGIGTIFLAIKYLFADGDVENSRINDLEAKSTLISKLLGNVNTWEGEYNWPTSVADIESGYLHELQTSIQNVLNEVGRVENKIGELPDGSDALEYIDAENLKLADLIQLQADEFKAILGDYTSGTSEIEDFEIAPSKYGGNNPNKVIYLVKPALDDIDDRLSYIEEFTIEGASGISDKIKEYERLLSNINSKIEGGSVRDKNGNIEQVIGVNKAIENSKKDLQESIDAVKLDLDSKLGKDGTTPTGLYADFKNYKDTLTSDFNSFELTLSLDLNDLKSEIGNYTEGGTSASGLRKEVEEIQANVSSYLEDCENTLVSKEKSLEAEAKTTLDTYVANATADINKAVSDASQAASNAQTEANKALALVDSAKDEVDKATEAIEGAKAIAPNLKRVRIKTREGVEQVSAIPSLDTDPITFNMGALGFYLNGEHLRTFAPGLGHSGDSADKMATVVTESDGTTKEYRSAFSLNYNSSDTVSAQLKTLLNGPEYRIPTLEFEATNVEIVDTTVDPDTVFKTLHILIVDKKPDNPVNGVFYFVKLA